MIRILFLGADLMGADLVKDRIVYDSKSVFDDANIEDRNEH